MAQSTASSRAPTSSQTYTSAPGIRPSAERRPSLPVTGMEQPFSPRHSLQPVPHSAGPDVTTFRGQFAEPYVAYLSTDLEILKVSPQFNRLFDMPLLRRNLRAIVHLDHSHQLRALVDYFDQERGQYSQPNTLAPLRSAESQILESLDFAEVDRVTRDFREKEGTWLFYRNEQRSDLDSIPYTISLAQRGTFFFVVLIIRPGSHLQPLRRPAYGLSSSRSYPAPSPYRNSEPTSPLSSMPQHLTTSLPSVGPTHPTAPAAPNAPSSSHLDWFSRVTRAEPQSFSPTTTSAPSTLPGAPLSSARMAYPPPQPQPPPPPPTYRNSARAIRPASLVMPPVMPSNSAPATPNHPDATFWEAGSSSSRRQSVVTPGSSAKRRASDGKTDEAEDTQPGGVRKKGRLMDIGELLD
jgi:hypothetical protein